MPRKSSSSVEPGPGSRRWCAGLIGCLLTSSVQAQPAAPSPALDVIAPLDHTMTIGYFVGDPETDIGALESDAELCTWALEDWVQHAQARLSVAPAAEEEALLRVYFVGPGRGQYGEMRPFERDGRRGASIFVRPDVDALDPELAAAARSDPLVRETIVYLTCLHELGHALGLEHTPDFADIMFYFGFGGDIPAYFGRYRARIEDRADIRRVSGLSPADITRLLALYPAP